MGKPGARAAGCCNVVDMPMEFCDLDCKYAGFPKTDAVDGSGSCRTFIALYCSRKKRLVHKNMPCPEKTARNQRKRRIRKGIKSL